MSRKSPLEKQFALQNILSHLNSAVSTELARLETALPEDGLLTPEQKTANDYIGRTYRKIKHIEAAQSGLVAPDFIRSFTNPATSTTTECLDYLRPASPEAREDKIETSELLSLRDSLAMHRRRGPHFTAAASLGNVVRAIENAIQAEKIVAPAADDSGRHDSNAAVGGYDSSDEKDSSSSAADIKIGDHRPALQTAPEEESGARTSPVALFADTAKASTPVSDTPDDGEDNPDNDDTSSQCTP